MTLIELTNEFDNLVYVNSDNITYMTLCELPPPEGEKLGHLGVEIHFVDNTSIKVQQCLREIRKRIYAFQSEVYETEYWTKPKESKE